MLVTFLTKSKAIIAVLVLEANEGFLISIVISLTGILKPVYFYKVPTI